MESKLRAFQGDYAILASRRVNLNSCISQNESFTIAKLIQYSLWSIYFVFTRGADKSLARPTSRCILFDGENISFDASLVIYINSNNIPPTMIINRIYETQNLLSL